MYNAHKITDKVAAGKLAIGSHVGFDDNGSVVLAAR